MSKVKELVSYGTHTIDEVIKVLQMFKEELGGDTQLHLADFECNARHREYEFNMCEGEKELFIFFERNDDWDD